MDIHKVIMVSLLGLVVMSILKESLFRNAGVFCPRRGTVVRPGTVLETAVAKWKREVERTHWMIPDSACARRTFSASLRLMENSVFERVVEDAVRHFRVRALYAFNPTYWLGRWPHANNEDDLAADALYRAFVALSDTQMTLGRGDSATYYTLPAGCVVTTSTDASHAVGLDGVVMSVDLRMTPFALSARAAREQRSEWKRMWKHQRPLKFRVLRPRWVDHTES